MSAPRLSRTEALRWGGWTGTDATDVDSWLRALEPVEVRDWGSSLALYKDGRRVSDVTGGRIWIAPNCPVALPERARVTAMDDGWHEVRLTGARDHERGESIVERPRAVCPDCFMEVALNGRCGCE